MPASIQLSGRKFRQKSVGRRVEADQKAVQQVIQLHDQWRTARGLEIDYAVGKETRQQANATFTKRTLAFPSAHAGIGVSLPSATVLGLEPVAKALGCSLNFVLARCLELGVGKLSVGKLVADYPDAEPSFSMVASVAVMDGYSEFTRKFGTPLAVANWKAEIRAEYRFRTREDYATIKTFDAPLLALVRDAMARLSSNTFSRMIAVLKAEDVKNVADLQAITLDAVLLRRYAGQATALAIRGMQEAAARNISPPEPVTMAATI